MLTQSLQSPFEYMGTLYASFMSLRNMADNMKKRAKKKFRTAMGKSTEWKLGEPLVFPTKHNSHGTNRLAREVIDPAIGEPLKNPIKRRGRYR